MFPSHTETCGLVALEAMASGVAVVAADAGGFRESVVHGRTGLLVPPDDARGFAAAIVRLALDGDRRRTLGIAARRFAVTRDCAAEDADLLAQYAAVAGTPAPAPTALGAGRGAPPWPLVRDEAAIVAGALLGLTGAVAAARLLL